ncbi:MAG: hypothetical protein LRY40_04160 [Shewanella fodinae]|nr:hypothetical protein [Shewanella fodinae]
MVAKLTQTIAIVPAKAGDYTLPEIKVAWWNPHLNQEEYATLPARHIKVKPASNAPAPDLSVATPQAVPTAPGYWPLATAVFAGLWLLTLGLWWRARKTRWWMLTAKLSQRRSQPLQHHHYRQPLPTMMPHKC